MATTRLSRHVFEQRNTLVLVHLIWPRKQWKAKMGRSDAHGRGRVAGDAARRNACGMGKWSETKPKAKIRRRS